MSDLRAAKQQVEKVWGEMPNQEANRAKLREASFYGSQDLLQGYWQCPLVPDALESFAIATPVGLDTPTRVPQKDLNVTVYFQATVTRALEGLNGMVWVGDVICKVEKEIVNTYSTITALLLVHSFTGTTSCTSPCVI